MTEQAFEHLAAEAGEHVAAAWRKIRARHGYHDPQQQNPPEAVMSLIAELKQDAKALVAKFEDVDEAAADRLASLEGNPVADALLAAAHVPPQALTIVVDVLHGLAAIYPKPDAAAAAPEVPAEAPVAA